MPENRTESVHFYDYLCQKIGSEKEVKVRRLAFIAGDLLGLQISSGSKSEGLDLKGSDIDTMFIDYDFTVYESEREAIQNHNAVLFMDTADTQPCFTRLRLYTNYMRLDQNYRELLQQHGKNYLLSNELFKQSCLLKLRSIKCFKIHGPCVSDVWDSCDFAMCLQCDKWISQAVPWISRPRSSWLSPETISKIIMSGILFVPIGFKGSIYEEFEWRISFSVAEKFLIFSFNHTQLLCYALLKIVLKEIIEKDKDLKGLLCSYYLKTLMFWISDDSDPTVWRPDNIIECFMACLHRLKYSVEYSTLLHYFISDNNFFHLCLGSEIEKKKKLIILLNNLYQQGIGCFSATETLYDYNRFLADKSIISKSNVSTRLVQTLLQTLGHTGFIYLKSTIPNVLNRLLHLSKTELSHDIFIFTMASVHQQAPQIPYTQQKQNNKQLYYKYKYDLSHLLIGLQSDAVSGWLMLASFFYVHENYLTALDIINYALSKFEDEKCRHQIHCGPNDLIKGIIFTPRQKTAFDMMKKEKLITILKALTSNSLLFKYKSQIVPQEMQLNVETSECNVYLPLTFAYFLRFLCCYHLNDHFSCELAFQNLTLANDEILSIRESFPGQTIWLRSTLLVGIAGEMMFGTDFAKDYYEFVADYDDTYITCAATRLCALRMDH